MIKYFTDDSLHDRVSRQSSRPGNGDPDSPSYRIPFGRMVPSRQPFKVGLLDCPYVANLGGPITLTHTRLRPQER